MNKTQFFNYLANGGKVKMITFRGEQVPAGHRLAGTRKAIKVQTNAVKFEGGSWLYKDDVKASEFREVFAGNDKPAIDLGWCIYQLVD